MLQDRIELSTSPLPMECSTTELRQRARIRESAETAPAGGAILATRAPLAQARGRLAGYRERPKSARMAASGAFSNETTPIRFRFRRRLAHGVMWSGGRGRGQAGIFKKPRRRALLSARSKAASRIGDCRRAKHAISGHGRFEASIRNGFMMTDEGDRPEGRAGRPAQGDARRDRLKEALRENLRRRKSQARGRGDIAASPSAGGIAAPHDGGGKKPGE